MRRKNRNIFVNNQQTLIFVSIIIILILLSVVFFYGLSWANLSLFNCLIVLGSVIIIFILAGIIWSSWSNREIINRSCTPNETNNIIPISPIERPLPSQLGIKLEDVLLYYLFNYCIWVFKSLNAKM